MAVSAIYSVARRAYRRRIINAKIASIRRSIANYESARLYYKKSFLNWRDDNESWDRFWLSARWDAQRQRIYEDPWDLFKHYIAAIVGRSAELESRAQAKIVAVRRLKAEYEVLGYFSEASLYARVITDTDRSQRSIEKIKSNSFHRNLSIAINIAATESIQNTSFQVDMESWNATLARYRSVFRATFIDAIVKRVAEVCYKLDRPGFLENIPELRGAIRMSARDQTKFYTQKSKWAGKMRNPKDLMFIEWMLSQYHGWGVAGNFGKRRSDARKWLPKVRKKIPGLTYGKRKDFDRNLRSAANKALDHVAKPKKTKNMVMFFRKALAVGANQLVNGDHGDLTPNKNSDILRSQSKIWQTRSARAVSGRRSVDKKTGKIRASGGVGIGWGKVYGTRNNVGARVFVPGKMFKRAVQPYVSQLFAQDVADMEMQIQKRLAKVNRSALSTGRRFGKRFLKAA